MRPKYIGGGRPTYEGVSNALSRSLQQSHKFAGQKILRVGPAKLHNRTLITASGVFSRTEVVFDEEEKVFEESYRFLVCQVNKLSNSHWVVAHLRLDNYGRPLGNFLQTASYSQTSAPFPDDDLVVTNPAPFVSTSTGGFVFLVSTSWGGHKLLITRGYRFRVSEGLVQPWSVNDTAWKYGHDTVSDVVFKRTRRDLNNPRNTSDEYSLFGRFEDYGVVYTTIATYSVPRGYSLPEGGYGIQTNRLLLQEVGPTNELVTYNAPVEKFAHNYVLPIKRYPMYDSVSIACPTNDITYMVEVDKLPWPVLWDTSNPMFNPNYSGGWNQQANMNNPYFGGARKTNYPSWTISCSENTETYTVKPHDEHSFASVSAPYFGRISAVEGNALYQTELVPLIKSFLLPATSGRICYVDSGNPVLSEHKGGVLFALGFTEKWGNHVTEFQEPYCDASGLATPHEYRNKFDFEVNYQQYTHVVLSVIMNGNLVVFYHEVMLPPTHTKLTAEVQNAFGFCAVSEDVSYCIIARMYTDETGLYKNRLFKLSTIGSSVSVVADWWFSTTSRLSSKTKGSRVPPIQFKHCGFENKPKFVLLDSGNNLLTIKIKDGFIHLDSKSYDSVRGRSDGLEEGELSEGLGGIMEKGWFYTYPWRAFHPTT